MIKIRNLLLFPFLFYFQFSFSSENIKYDIECIKNDGNFVNFTFDLKFLDNSKLPVPLNETQTVSGSSNNSYDTNFVGSNIVVNDNSISFVIEWDDGSSSTWELFSGVGGEWLADGGADTNWLCSSMTIPTSVGNISNENSSSDSNSNQSKVDTSKPHVLVELISYEDKKDYEDKPYCEMEFTFTNNSFGTIYEMNISTEGYDDRGDKLDDYAFKDTIQAFGDFWSSEEEMKIGNSATSKSLSLDSKCQYIQDIYMTKVKNKYCNIRMLPEGFDCLDLVVPSSKIDHINFKFK